MYSRDTSTWSLYDVLHEESLKGVANNVIKYMAYNWQLTTDGKHVAFVYPIPNVGPVIRM